MPKWIAVVLSGEEDSCSPRCLGNMNVLQNSNVSKNLNIGLVFFFKLKKLKEKTQNLTLKIPEFVLNT